MALLRAYGHPVLLPIVQERKYHSSCITYCQKLSSIVEIRGDLLSVLAHDVSGIQQLIYVSLRIAARLGAALKSRGCVFQTPTVLRCDLVSASIGAVNCRPGIPNSRHSRGSQALGKSELDSVLCLKPKMMSAWQPAGDIAADMFDITNITKSTEKFGFLCT